MLRQVPSTEDLQNTNKQSVPICTPSISSYENHVFFVIKYNFLETKQKSWN